ncbi:hypothetical protein SRB5_08170 [Streptomyces sp. RB5]|uniref:Hemoglobin n=1 Tax=Streptomyces smaragdinus TaxID=2585196 RepID=A0A7K0CD63_9ACTN|nr:group III truncated hemoglobin [Streptomyces smaragdinus]MQY10704.1 hypothetical protein [Streptomyces smaragdinus]
MDVAAGHRADGDIAGRGDLDTLLHRFYGAAFADPLIGPFFTEIAGTDLDEHMPHILDFWDRALFRTPIANPRDPLAVHVRLHRHTQLTAEHFGRWVQLWHASVDGRHRGPVAERAKKQGERVALAMLRRLSGPEASTDGTGPGFVPLAALRLRTAA